MRPETDGPRRRRSGTHPMRQAWDRGEVAVTSWCSSPTAYMAEAMAMLDWDCMAIDMQHGLTDLKDLFHIIQGVETAGSTAIVRLPWNDVGMAQKILDAGATGLIAPMINTAEDCARFVGACKFPPVGYRSFGAMRASNYYTELNEMFERGNTETLAFAMVETVEAMRNLEGIVSVAGLDGIFVGPADMAASAGRAPAIGVMDGFMLETHTTILQACRRHGLKAGINAKSIAAARELADLGYDFIALHSDVGMVLEMSRGLLKEARGVLQRGDGRKPG